jgi:hypothetical protein
VVRWWFGLPAGVAALRRLDRVTCGIDAGGGGKWRVECGGYRALQCWCERDSKLQWLSERLRTC